MDTKNTPLISELISKYDTQDQSKQDRINKAEKDFEFFCNTYLPHYFSCEPAAYHLVIYDIVNKSAVNQQDIERLKTHTRKMFHNYFSPIEKLRGIIDIESRDHAKSVRFSFAYPLWRALFKKNKFTVIFGNNDDDAKLFLENIKSEFDENELILEDFGDLKGSRWDAKFIELSNGTAIAARSKGGSARGLRFREARPDLVILDDIVKDEEADNLDTCEKINRWIRRTVMNLGKDAFIIFVNTHFNENDPATRMLYEAVSGKLEGFLPLRFSAQLEDGTPIWPERWSRADLELKRREVGSDIYQVEYLSLSVSAADKMFRKNWFAWFNINDIDLTTRRITFGVDPNAEGSDDAAIAVCAYDKIKKYRDIIDWWNKPYGTAKDLMDQLFSMYEVYNPEQIAFEEVAFQKIYRKWILEAAAERGIYLPCIGVKPGSTSKKKRIMQIQPYVEAGIMRYRDSFKSEPEMEQWYSFPTPGVNDGLLDAGYYAVLISVNTNMIIRGTGIKRRGNYVKQMMRRYMNG